MKKKMLRQFVKEKGGQEKAAAALGVSFSTLSRWLHGHNRPTGLSAEKLEQMGISIK